MEGMTREEKQKIITDWLSGAYSDEAMYKLIGVENKR